MIASHHISGYIPVERIALHKSHKYTAMTFELCFNISYGKPSIPGDLLFSKLLRTFSTSDNV